MTPHTPHPPMVAYTRPLHAPGSVQGRRAIDAAQRGPSAGSAGPGATGESFAATVAGAAPRAAGGTGVGTPGGPHPTSLLDALADALRSERKLVDDLAGTMRRQRAAVAVDDLPTIDDTVFATHRLLATLGQARLRRKQVNRLLGGAEDLPLRHLEACVGPQMTDALREARDLLADAATALAAEVDVNRRVLRDALAHGEQHARVLAGAGGPPGSHPGSHPGSAATAASAASTAASLAEADAGARYAAIAAAGTNPAGARARAGHGRAAGPLLVNRTA